MTLIGVEKSYLGPVCSENNSIHPQNHNYNFSRKIRGDSRKLREHSRETCGDSRKTCGDSRKLREHSRKKAELIFLQLKNIITL